MIPILFKYKADPNTIDKYYGGHWGGPVFFPASIDVAQLFLAQNVNIHATENEVGTNVLWYISKNDYPLELMQFYLQHHVDATKLDHQGNCLLHVFAEKWFFPSQEHLENFLKKVALLINTIPNLINSLNDHGQTPLDLAQQSLNEPSVFIHGLSYMYQYRRSQAIKNLITLFRKRDGLTAQELTQQKAPDFAKASASRSLKQIGQ